MRERERERERERISERSGAWQKPHDFRMQNKVNPQTHIQERQTVVLVVV